MLDEIYLRLLLELIPSSLKLTGLDVRRLIEQFNDSSQSKRAYGELIKHIYQDEPESDIGLKFGQHLHPATLCDLSRALMTAPDVASVIKLIEGYHYVHGASYYPVFHTNEDTFSMALTYPYKERVSWQQRRFCSEAVFSYTLNALQETICKSIKPQAVNLDFAPPKYAKQYEEHFQCPIQFNAPLATITFDNEWRFRKLFTHDTTLHQLYLNKSLDTWQRSERLQDFEYRAITQLMKNHPHSFNSQKLAAKLNISVRGLQKRLNKHGESFSHLASIARRELAKVYLFQQMHSVEYTAEQLGFQTASGFRRFFKAEFDQTPAEFVEDTSL